MSLQDDLRSALSSAVESLISEFPSTVTISRRQELLETPGNRPYWEEAPLLNGEGATALIQAPTTSLIRKNFGRDAAGEAVAIVSDRVPADSGDKIAVTGGPYLGSTFWIVQRTPGYMAGINLFLLTVTRPPNWV